MPALFSSLCLSICSSIFLLNPYIPNCRSPCISQPLTYLTHLARCLLYTHGYLLSEAYVRAANTSPRFVFQARRSGRASSGSWWIRPTERTWSWRRSPSTRREPRSSSSPSPSSTRESPSSRERFVAVQRHVHTLGRFYIWSGVKKKKSEYDAEPMRDFLIEPLIKWKVMWYFLCILIFRSYSCFNSFVNEYEEPVVIIIYSLDLLPCLWTSLVFFSIYFFFFLSSFQYHY